jgi:hypothetical protein
VPTGSVAVSHDAPPELTVAVHSVAAPEVKVTLPVASAGSPDAERPAVPPYPTLDGLAEALIDVAA